MQLDSPETSRSDSSSHDPERARNEGTMTVSELCARSALPLSTVKFYLRERLIPRPRKVRGTRAYYDARHLHRLRLIKKIQSEGKVPLAKIREIVSLLDERERADAGQSSPGAAELRKEIVLAALRVFREKGYEGTTIGDIAAAARVGRSTLYKHFGNKKELFIECVKSVVFSEVAERQRDGAPESDKATDAVTVFDRHARAYHEVNPLWYDMVKQLRAAAINHPAEFAPSLEEVIQLKIDLLRRGIEKGIRAGWFRKINATLMTVMLLGLQDYREYLGKALSNKTMDDLYEDAKDIILHGILKR